MRESGEELREEVGVRESLVRSRLKWAGHMERMEGEPLAKRADALRVGNRRGRPRWERFGKSGREWRMRARDGRSGDGWWRQTALK